MNFPFPDRDDEKEARRWRGYMFEGFSSPLMWRDKWKGHYEEIERPNSVTFPICHFCGHVIWDSPYFEEEVPESEICEACYKDEIKSQERDDDIW